MVAPLVGELGAHRAFFFFRALKLIFINLGGKNEIPLGVPPTPNKGTTTCPAPPKQHSGPLFGPASLRKMWRVSFVLMHASSGELWHSSGELRRALARSSKFRAKLRGAGFWVTMCFYGHVCQLRRAPASSGEVVKISRGAGFWVTMGFYGHVKSRYTFWGHLGPFPQLRQISPELATSSGNRKPRQVNRITGQVSVYWQLY